MPVRNLKYLNTEMLNVLTIGWALINEERMITAKRRLACPNFIYCSSTEFTRCNVTKNKSF